MLKCLAGIHKCMAIPASEELSTLVAPSSLSTQSAVGDRHFFIWEKSAYLAEVSVTDFTEISKPRNPWGTEHDKQCVLGSFSSAHAWEPGTRQLHYQHNYMHTHHQCWLMMVTCSIGMRRAWESLSGLTLVLYIMYMYVQCTVNIHCPLHILPENCSQDITQEDGGVPFPSSISN